MNEEVTRCNDCWGYHNLEELHTCPPLLKALVARKRKQDETNTTTQPNT